MSLRLSIVLPCYNVEKYIKRCLDSIYAQDIPESDYEIIIVNDCTPDNSIVIARKFQTCHTNVHIIKHLHNKGLGAARNTGLKAAKGKYIWFIDTDDFIQSNCLSKTLELLDINNLDILTFNFLKQDSNLLFNENSINTNSESEVLKGPSFLDYYYQPSTMSCCTRIYNTDYLRKNKFYFEEGVYWEDADWVVKSIYHSERTLYTPAYLYYYCFNSSSISRSTDWKKSADMVKMGYRKALFAENISKESPALSNRIIQDASWNAMAIKKVVFLNNKDRQRFYKAIVGDVQQKMGDYVLKKQMKFLYKQQKLSTFLLFFASPLLKLTRKK